MANYLGIMSVKLGADYATLQSDLGKAAMLNARYAQDMEKQFHDAGLKIGRALSVGAAAAATAITAIVKSSIDSADQLSKLSQKVGITTESLSALKMQASLSDISIESLETSLKKFNKTIADAAGGGKLQSETFRAMGISLTDANGKLKSTEVLLGDVADKFAGYKDGAAKTALAMNLFGRAGADMIVQLNGGREAMEDARKEAEDFGQIIGTETGKQAEQFNDNLTRAGFLVTGLGNALAAQLLPALVGVTDEFIEGERKAKNFETTAEGLANVIKTLAGAGIIIKNVLDGLGITIIAIGKSAWSAGVLMTEMMTAPAAAAAAFARDGVDGVKKVLGGIAASANDAKQTWSDAWIAFKGGWSDAGTDIMSGIDALDSAIKKTIDSASGNGGGEDAPFVPLGDGAAKAAKSIEKLQQALASSQEKMSDLAGSFAVFSDPMDEVMAKFKEQMTDIGRAAEEQQAIIQSLSDAGLNDEAAAAQVVLQNDIATAIANATAARDLSIAAIERERDITGRYLEELADEARLIGLTSTQARVETTVLRALAEAKKLNAAAGKEVAKVDEARIRQQAKLNEALSLAANINAKSPIFEMIDQAKELSDQIKKGIQQGWDPIFLKPFEDALEKLNTQITIDSIGGIKAFLGAVQTFTKEGSSGFKNLEKGMAALSIIQDILAIKAAVTAVLSQGASPPPMSFAAMAAMAAAVAPLLASIGLTMSAFGGGSFSDTAGKRQASQGTGSVLGDSEAKSESIANAIQITADATSALVGINRGMLRALIALQDGLGGAANQLARGAGDADFSGLDLSTEGNLSIWEQNDLIGRLIGGSSEITDQGIIIMGGALNDLLENIAVGAYQEVQSQSSFFGSTHTNEGIVDVSDELGRQFQLVIGSIVDTVREGAEALGLLPADIEAALAAFQVEEIRISLMDLSAEEQQAELAAVFSEIFDGLAGSIVPFISQFQQVGEGLGETLIRVATGVQVTQEAMRQLGLVISETDPERFAQISEGLMHAVGGIEEFVEGMNTFVSSFADEGHRLRIATEAINSAFEQAGLTVPATTEGMWELMQSLDATTAEGQEQIATLLRLADTASAYYDLIERAETSRLEYIMKASDIQTELGIGGGFASMRAEIESWTTSTIQSLNSLARAAGRAGASEQDLVNVHRLAAQRIAQLIEKLKGELRDLAVTLGYTTAGDTLESLNAQIASMGSTSFDAANAIGSAVDSMREKMALLLGDLSPFNDQKKLELALEGLRAGTVDPETVLEIGRRLYASTSNYTNLFNQVMGMAQFGQNGGTNTSSEEGRTLAELIAARDALLAATRPQLAEELASRIAELANATGDEFAAIAAEQGFNLAQLGADLGLNSDELNAYLEQLQAQFESQDFGAVGEMIQEAINRSADRIVEAITGKPIESVIEASDQHMQELAERQKSDREESDARVIAAINGLTSAVVASGAENTGEIVEVLELTRRDLREERNATAGSTERGRIERVFIR